MDTAISAALTPCRKARAVHDPGKILLDVALAVALGGDCLADVAMLLAVFGPAASDPTVSCLIDTLAAAGPKAPTAIRAARAEARRLVWRLAGREAPDAGGTVTVDRDAREPCSLSTPWPLPSRPGAASRAPSCTRITGRAVHEQGLR